MNLSAEKKRAYWRAGLIAFLALAVLPASFMFYDVHALLLDAVHFVESYGAQFPVLGAFLFTVLTVLAATISIIGILPLVPSAVLVWGAPITLALILMGWLTGALVMYFLGRKSVTPAFTDADFYKRVKSLEAKMSGRAEFMLVFLLRLSMPAEAMGYALGLMKYRFDLYLLATFLTELPYAIMSVYGSKAFLEQDTMQMAIWAGAAALLIAFAAFMAFRNRNQN